MKELTKEQLEGVMNAYECNWKSKLFKKALKDKGLIKEEFEVGKWYKGKRYNGVEVLFVCGLDSYGFYDGDFIDLEDFSSDYLNDEDYGYELRPATDKEVETALIKEAKKRGFKEGVKFLSARDGDIRTATNEFYSFDNWNKYTTLQLDTAWIFKGGKWATIIEEPKVESYGTPFKCLDECPKIEGYELESLRADGLVTYQPINK